VPHGQVSGGKITLEVVPRLALLCLSFHLGADATFLLPGNCEQLLPGLGTAAGPLAGSMSRLHDCKCRKHSMQLFDVLRAAGGVTSAVEQGVGWPFVVHVLIERFTRFCAAQV